MSKKGRPKGFKMSNESIKTLKESLSTRTVYYKRKVKINNFIFSSVTDAARFYNVAPSTVCYRIAHNWADWSYHE